MGTVQVVVDVIIPLATVLLTLMGGWLVTTRVTDRWDQVKRRREMDLAAAQDFQRFYGEFFSIWKAWNTVARQNIAISDGGEANVGLPEPRSNSRRQGRGAVGEDCGRT